MLSIIVLRKKIGIGKNRYRQVTLTKKNQKSESAKKIAVRASLFGTARAVTITALPLHRGNEMPTAVLRSSPSSPHFFPRDPSRFLAKRE